MLADKGEGWHCMISRISGDVYHHLPDDPVFTDLDTSLPDTAPLEGHTLHLVDSIEGSMLETNEKPPLEALGPADIIAADPNPVENIDKVCDTAETACSSLASPQPVEVATVMIESEACQVRGPSHGADRYRDRGN